jgi:hypothetical protein
MEASTEPWNGKTGFYISSGTDEQARIRADALYGIVAEVGSSKEFGIQVDSWFDDVTPGSILTSVLRHITQAAVVFADLTGSNANVYYEIGVAHSFGVPVVTFIRKGERAEFDLAGERTIQVEFSDDMVANQSAIRTTIRKVLKHIQNHSDEVLTPVQAAGLI